MRTLMPDGRWLSVSGNKHGLLGPWIYMMWVHQSGSFAIQAVSLGSAEAIAVHEGRREHTTVREASLRGSRLVSLEDTERGGTTFVWQGDFHEVSTYVPGVRIPMESFIAKLSLLDLTDTREGVLVRAAPGLGASVVYRTATNFIPDIGTIGVRSVDPAGRPTTSGRPVRGGRLWRDDLKDPDDTVTRSVLTIINESSVTTLAPFRPDDPRLRPLVESLNVSLE